MSKKAAVKLNAYYWHEALDRSCICIEMADQYILFHPAIEDNEELKLKAQKAHQLLFEIYQGIGSIMLAIKNSCNSL